MKPKAAISEARRSRNRRLLLAFILVASFTASCLSRGEDPCGEGPGVDGLLASAERWLALVPTSYDDVDLSGEQGYATVRVQAAPVDESGGTGAVDEYSIAIHPTTVPDVRDALDEGETVFLALSSAGLERELVMYEIALSPAGAHRLLNDGCGRTELLQTRLGDTFDARMARLIGETDQEGIEALLRPPPTSP